MNAYIEGKLYKTYKSHKRAEYVVGNYKEFIYKVKNIYEAISNKEGYNIGIDLYSNPYITSNTRIV